MTFIYELDPYSCRYTGCANINFLSQGFGQLSTDRQTDMTEIIYHATSWVVKYGATVASLTSKLQAVSTNIHNGHVM